MDRLRTTAVWSLLVLALVASCSDEPDPAPESRSECARDGVPASAFGLTPGSQEDLAGGLGRALFDGSEDVRRIDACTLTFGQEGPRLQLGEDSAGRPTLRRASSFADGDVPAVSLSVRGGDVSILSPLSCTGCTDVQFEMVAAQGRLPRGKVPLGGEVKINSPGSWTDRGVLLRFVDQRGTPRGYYFLSFPDGDFAAG